MAKKKILIVEDEESLFALERILLTSRGYAVDGAIDGISALNVIARNPPDLVLLDIMIPGLDGLEVCRRIKDDPATSHIPVILLTSKQESRDLDLGLEAGADWYITKPFKSAKILDAVNRLLAC